MTLALVFAQLAVPPDVAPQLTTVGTVPVISGNVVVFAVLAPNARVWVTAVVRPDGSILTTLVGSVPPVALIVPEVEGVRVRDCAVPAATTEVAPAVDVANTAVPAAPPCRMLIAPSVPVPP